MMCDLVDVHVIQLPSGSLAVSKPECSLGYLLTSPMCQAAHDGLPDPCPHFIPLKED